MVVMLAGLSSRQMSEQLLAASSKTSAGQAWASGPKLKHVAAKARNMWPLHVTVVRASEATGNAPTDAGRRAERFTSPRRVHPARRCTTTASNPRFAQECQLLPQLRRLSSSSPEPAQAPAIARPFLLHRELVLSFSLSSQNIAPSRKAHSERAETDSTSSNPPTRGRRL